jgi:ABC-type transport system substrate-binding protein
MRRRRALVRGVMVLPRSLHSAAQKARRSGRDDMLSVAGLKPDADGMTTSELWQRRRWGVGVNWRVGVRGIWVTREQGPFGTQGKQEWLCNRLLVSLFVFAGLLAGCGRTVPQKPGTITFLIESGPANLDPRFATDGQSQRIVGLVFNGLVERDEQMNLRGDLAESWENPDPLTYVFHLRPGVKFHDGRALTSADVKATFDFMLKVENGSPKRGAFRAVESITAPDAATVVFRLKEPYASFVWNLARPAIGIVPADAGADFGGRLIGTGPFRFVSQAHDEEVVLERNLGYFRGEKEGDKPNAEYAETGTQPSELRAGRTERREENSPPSAKGAQSGAPGERSDPRAQTLRDSGQAGVSVPREVKIRRVVFRIVPDAVTRALELRKGSGDVEMSSLSADMIPELAKQKDLGVSERAGTNLAYIGINVQDAILARKEVRQALAYATDRALLIKYLLHGQAQVASGLLPPNHWAYESDVRTYDYDLAQAEQLLDAAGFPRKSEGMRFKLTLKVSTEEQARLIGAALQDQWKKAGVDLEVRPLEIATLFADLGKGNFQLSYSKWIGANNDPDVFAYVMSTKRFPPDGANRGHYRNAHMDLLTEEIGREMDREKRRALCSMVQKMAAEDVPFIALWFTDVVSVHRRSMGEIALTATGDYEFLGED